jgi:hypothetical protein
VYDGYDDAQLIESPEPNVGTNSTDNLALGTHHWVEVGMTLSAAVFIIMATLLAVLGGDDAVSKYLIT